MPSALENALLSAPARNYHGEFYELCVLRDVLSQRVGTAAQRNTLLRIIKAHAPKGRNVTSRLLSNFGMQDSSCVNVEAQGPSVVYSDNLPSQSPPASPFDFEEDDEDEEPRG